MDYNTTHDIVIGTCIDDNSNSNNIVVGTCIDVDVDQKDFDKRYYIVDGIMIEKYYYHYGELVNINICLQIHNFIKTGKSQNFYDDKVEYCVTKNMGFGSDFGLKIYHKDGIITIRIMNYDDLRKKYN